MFKQCVQVMSSQNWMLWSVSGLPYYHVRSQDNVIPFPYWHNVGATPSAPHGFVSSSSTSAAAGTFSRSLLKRWSISRWMWDRRIIWILLVWHGYIHCICFRRLWTGTSRIYMDWRGLTSSLSPFCRWFDYFHLLFAFVQDPGRTLPSKKSCPQASKLESMLQNQPGPSVDRL